MDGPAPTPTVTGRIVVSGTGRVAVTPDLADLRLGISLVRPTVALARADAATVLDAVIRAVRAAGVDRGDIRTTDLSLQPRYDHRDSGPVLTGYELSELVGVTVRDLGRVAAVVDGALEAGATSMDGFDARLADPTAAEEQARRAAVRAARAAATTLAAAADLELDGVVDIVEGGSGGIPRPFAKMERLMSADVATPIEAGTAEVAVTVAVTFATRAAAR